MEDYFQQIRKNNSLLINYCLKFCLSEEHTSTNLSVLIIFCADSVYVSIPPKYCLRAALQVQFEYDQDKGVLQPTKLTCGIIPMYHNTVDPIFQHVTNMVQNTIAYHLKSPKEVYDFAANNYKNE